MIWYWDTARNIRTPLCSRADCTHDSAECNAWLKYICPSTMQMVNGKLYVWALSGVATLYQVNTDGSGYIKILTAPKNWQPLNSWIIGDDVYVFLYGGQDANFSNMTALYRLSMTGSHDPEVIMDTPPDDGWDYHSFGRVNWFDEGLFYEQKSVSSDLVKTRTYLYRYDPETHESELILQQDHDLTYWVTDGNLLYCWTDVEDSETVVMSLQTGEIIRTVPVHGGLRGDDRYIYLNDFSIGQTATVEIYDHEFRHVDTFAFETDADTQAVALCMSESHIVFYYSVPNEEGWYDDVYHLYSKEDIGKADHTCLTATIPCLDPR